MNCFSCSKNIHKEIMCEQCSNKFCSDSCIAFHYSFYHQNGNNWANGYQGPPSGVQTETSGNTTYYYTTITAKYGEDITDQWPKYEDYPNLDNDNNHNNGQYTFVSWYMMNDAAGYKGTGSGNDTFKGIII